MFKGHTVREFKNDQNKNLLSCKKEDEIWEYNAKSLKSYQGIFSQKSTLKKVHIFDQIKKKSSFWGNCNLK